MKRPGTRLRAIAARLFDAHTMEHYVDPAVTDLQTEYEETSKHGRRRDRARAYLAGYVGVIQVISIQAGVQAIESVRDLSAEDRRPVVRTLLAGAPVFIITTAILVAPFVLSLSRSRATDFAVYLIPQALPLSIPVALTFGILWTLSHLSASRTALALVLALALGGSLLSFATLAWVMPNANQAFRMAVAGVPVAKGNNELTIGELRERMANPSHYHLHSSWAQRNLALNYHGRWALGAAPFVLAILAIIVATSRKPGRVMRVVFGLIVPFGFYTLMSASRGLALDRTLSPFAAAWAPNAVMLMLAAAVMSLRAHRRNRNGHVNPV
jgi:hypothetical protein